MAAPAGLTGWLASRWSHLNGPQRIAGVDLARALAIIGMFAAHLLWVPDFEFTEPASWVAIVDGRSSILFATLAGVSIGLVTGGPTPIGAAAMRVARGRLAVRAGLLWVIGVLLIATGVPVYVILPAYAILFLLALPLTRLPARVLFLLAGALAVVMPFVQALIDELPFWSTLPGFYLSQALGFHYPFPVWIAFVVAGLGAARAGLTRLRTLGWMLGAGAALAIASFAIDQVSGADPEVVSARLWDDIWTAHAHSSGLLEVIGSGGFALAVIAASILVCRTFVRWLVLPLRALGSMPLTAYSMQIIVWAVIAAIVLGETNDLSGFRDLGPFWPFVLWSIVGCTAWALLIGRGPLEWATDRAARLAVRGPLTSSPASGGPTPIDRLNQ